MARYIYRKRRIIPILIVLFLGVGGGIYAYNKIIETGKVDVNERTEIKAKVKVDENKVVIDGDAIKESLNDVCEYPVLELESVPIKNIPVEVTESIMMPVPFGDDWHIADASIRKTANTKVKGKFIIESLSTMDLVVDENNKKITVTVDKPILDKDSIQEIEGAFNLVESKTDVDLLAKITIAFQALFSEYKETLDARSTRDLKEKVVPTAYNKIKTLYNENISKKEELETSAKESVKYLIELIVNEMADEDYKVEVIIRDK